MCFSCQRKTVYPSDFENELEALNFGALNVVFNTWVFLGFFTYEIWAEVKKSCGNSGPLFVDIWRNALWGATSAVVC